MYIIVAILAPGGLAPDALAAQAPLNAIRAVEGV